MIAPAVRREVERRVESGISYRRPTSNNDADRGINIASSCQLGHQLHTSSPDGDGALHGTCCRPERGTDTGGARRDPLHAAAARQHA